MYAGDRFPCQALFITMSHHPSCFFTFEFVPDMSVWYGVAWMLSTFVFRFGFTIGLNKGLGEVLLGHGRGGGG